MDNTVSHTSGGSTTQSTRSSYSEKLAAAAHDALESVGDKAVRTKERLCDAADDLQRRSHAARDRARDLADEAVMQARSHVKEHPLASHAVAFGVGILMSAIMRR